MFPQLTLEEAKQARVEAIITYIMQAGTVRKRLWLARLMEAEIKRRRDADREADRTTDQEAEALSALGVKHG